MVVWVIFWASLVVTFLADVLGLFETSNLGFTEEIWISWIAATVGLGVVLTIYIRFSRDSRQISQPDKKRAP